MRSLALSVPSRLVFAAGLILDVTISGCGGEPSEPDPEPATPTELAFLTQPGTTEGTVPLNPAPQVVVLDQFGERVDTATHPVTLALGENPAGGSLSGGTVVAAATGLATFSDLRLDRPGVYTLTASAPGLQSATSAQFQITLTFTTVHAGTDHTCAMTSAPAAYCWGLNHNGQLGDGTTTARSIPALVATPAGTQFATLRAGGGHTCAMTAAGAAYCWGRAGMTGDAATQDRRTPPLVPIPAGLTFTSLSASFRHTCGSTTDGDGYCWGESSSVGKLGDGSTDYRATPVRVAAPTGVRFVEVSTGFDHSCGITETESIYCWGWGSGPTPVEVTAPDGATFVSVRPGMAHTCALTPAGAVYCWGNNQLGQLGDGTNEGRPTPTHVAAPAGVTFVELSVGWEFSCARTAGGTVYCWGKDADGQLGDGSPDTGSSTPGAVPVPSGIVFTAISAGSDYACALTPQGAAYCWGRNDGGKLGNGAGTGYSAVPVQVVQ